MVEQMELPKYPNATSLVITADGGGSNGYRLRLWKLELQGFVDELGFPVTVCHLPPGTSKWNKIEHRLFSFITQNWRGKPLVTPPGDRESDIGHDDGRRAFRVSSSLDQSPLPERSPRLRHAARSP